MSLDYDPGMFDKDGRPRKDWLKGRNFFSAEDRSFIKWSCVCTALIAISWWALS